MNAYTIKRFLFTCRIEFILMVRNFFGFFFGLIFPLMMLVLFGTIFGNQSVSPGSDLRMMDLSIQRRFVKCVCKLFHKNKQNYAIPTSALIGFQHKRKQPTITPNLTSKKVP